MLPQTSTLLSWLQAAVCLLAAMAAANADTMAEAVRQLASVVPARSRVALTVENRAGLDESQVQEFRKALIEQMAPVEIVDDGQPLRILLSDNVRGLLAIAQFGQRTVMVPWTPAGNGRRARAKIAATAVWRQNEPVLDAFVTPPSMLVLEPGRVVLYRRSGESWQFERGAALAWAVPMPRDARGRLSGNLESFRVATPAGACSGSAVPSLTVTCGDSTVANPWVAGRNVQRQAVLGEFYSVAELPDGKAITATAAGSRGTGSQVAAIRSGCGVTWLAAGATTGDTDTVTGMTTAGAAATEILSVDGSVTELWSGDAAVTAVVQRNHSYEILLLAIACPE